MKFGEVYRHKENGVTVLVIGRLIRELQVEEGGNRMAQPGETVLMTLDQGAYGDDPIDDPAMYWLAGKTGYDTGGLDARYWELIGEVKTP